MPTSRNRPGKKNKPKKKAKRNVSKKNPPSDTDSAIINGLKIERTGNMLYTHNIRTEEEQTKFIADLEEQHPALKKHLNELIGNALNIFETNDNIALLGALNYNAIVKQQDNDDDGLSEVILEYAMSIAAAKTDQKKLKLPSGKILNNLIDLLGEIRRLFLQYYVSETILDKKNEKAASPAISDLRLDVIAELLTIRGTGYYDHVEELFLELFSLHDEFFLKHYGFKAIDVTNTLHEFETAFSLRLEFADGMPNPSILQRFMDWAFANHVFPPSPTPTNVKLFSVDNPDILVLNNRITTFKLNDVESYKELFKVRYYKEPQKKVVEALQLRFGDNSGFLQEDIPANALSSTLVKEKPFMRDSGENDYLFSFSLPSRNFLLIGQKLIEEKDPAYYQKYYLGKAYEKSRDKFVEGKVKDIFSNFLKDVSFHLNVNYQLNQANNSKPEFTELDILGDGSGEVYLIEIKAGELNDAARRGATDSLITRLKKNVGKGASQGERALNYILQNDDPVFYDKKNEIHISKSKKVYRIVITLDNFSGLLTKLNTLQDAEVISKAGSYPWVIHIYDLMVFAEIIESKEDFNAFLDKRLALNDWKEFTTHDEINLLGHFLDEDLEFEAEKRKLDHFTLGHYTQDIDAYFYAKQMGKTIAKPKRTKKR